MEQNKKIDKVELEELYIDQDLTQKEIAKLLSCSVSTIQKYLKEYNITKSRAENLKGKKFGKLLVMYQAEDFYNANGVKFIMWHCKCDCGNEKDVKAAYLKSGSVSSCGCIRREWNSINKKIDNEYDLSGEYGIGYTTKGEPFYFDLEDFDKIKDYCWSINSEGYVVARKRGSGKFVKMHQIIMNAKHIDHIKHLKYDNRKSQLRLSNDALNSRNRATPSNNTSGHKGVRWNKKNEAWEAYISIDHKWKYLGQYSDYEQAVIARERADELYFKEWSYNNSMEFNLKEN